MYIAIFVRSPRNRITDSCELRTEQSHLEEQSVLLPSKPVLHPQDRVFFRMLIKIILGFPEDVVVKLYVCV